MPRREPFQFLAQNGFVPSQPRLDGVPGSLIDGRNFLVLGNGKIVSAKGVSAGGASGAPRPAMNVSATYGGVSSYGTLLSFYNVLLAAGSGTVTQTGVSLGTVSNALAINTGSGLVLAGIPAPVAPSVNALGASGSVLGAYSLALTAVRILGNVTGESSRGTPSATVYLSNKKFRVTAWPATPTGCDATRDKWGLYFPFRGFPTQGPWRHFADVPMNTALPYDIDFLDGQLGHLAPLDHDPPPTAHFLFSIDNVVTVVGPGGQLNPSVPLQPDAYPPDQAVFLARGESVTSCRGAGASGRIALACANSLHEVFSSGSDDITPIVAIPRWPSVGFVGSSSWCFVGDMIFGMTGAMGAVMGTLDSQPQTEFAKDVQTFFEDNGFTSANTVVGYDPSINAVVFMSGTLAVPFMLAIGKWSTPVTLPGTASTAVTVNGQLQIDIGGTMYIFEGGTGTAAYGVYAFQDFGSDFLKTVVRLRAVSDATVTVQPLFDLSTSDTTYTAFTSSAQHGNPQRLRIRQITSFSAKVSLASASRKTVDKLTGYQITHQSTNHR